MCSELLKIFGVENAKAISTHMNTSSYLDKDERGKSMEERKFRYFFRV